MKLNPGLFFSFLKKLAEGGLAGIEPGAKARDRLPAGAGEHDPRFRAEVGFPVHFCAGLAVGRDIEVHQRARERPGKPLRPCL